MQILIAMLCLLLQYAAGLDDDFKIPTSQFKFEYEVLKELLMFSKDIEMLKNENAVQGEINIRLQTGRYLGLVNRQ